MNNHPLVILGKRKLQLKFSLGLVLKKLLGDTGDKAITFVKIHLLLVTVEA